MTRLTITCCVLLLVMIGGVWAEQIGGPSGPAGGELRVGVESNFRDHIDGLAVGLEYDYANEDSARSRQNGYVLVAEPARASTHTFYGVLQYGLTDRLSVRGKAGIGKAGIDAMSVGIIPNDLVDSGYGFAWAAGLQYRICAPDGHGTSLALSGQYARLKPDDFVSPMGLFSNSQVEEITGALTVGTTLGKARPYAGIVYSDLEARFDIAEVGAFVAYPVAQQRAPLAPPLPWTFEKDNEIGAVFGLDQTLGGSGWLNLEARAWDEASFSAMVGLSW